MGFGIEEFYTLAWGYFEEAIDFHPENNIEAINRYARHLLDRKRGEKAFEVLDRRLTSLQRIRFRLPALLRKEAMELLGMNTASADEEIDIVNRRLAEAEPLMGASFGPNGGVSPQFVHSNLSDDCRGRDYTTYFCGTTGCYYTVTLNLAEVLYNEAPYERWGAIDMVGWTVRDRAFQRFVFPTDCDYYPGQDSPCTLLCNDPNYCDASRRYCCALHGGTISTGSPQVQFNDSHVAFSTLDSSGFAYEALLILNGMVPEVSTNWNPPGTSGCSYGCDAPFCFYGSNVFNPSPRGPMEFRGRNYYSEVSALPQYQCKRWKADVCGNTTGSRGDNYFWNRRTQ